MKQITTLGKLVLFRKGYRLGRGLGPGGLPDGMKAAVSTTLRVKATAVSRLLVT